LPTNVPEEMSEVLKDAALMAQETDEMVLAIKEKRISVAATKALADSLRDRMAALDIRMERLETIHLGQTIAYKQRTGIDAQPGVLLTEEDLLQGERIAEALLTKPKGATH
jgi:hypothetical protein